MKMPMMWVGFAFLVAGQSAFACPNPPCDGYLPPVVENSFDQSQRLVVQDLEAKAREGSSIQVLANPYKLTAIAIGKIFLTVVRDLKDAEALTDWRKIEMNSSLNDIVVTPTSAYGTWVGMKGVSLFVGDKRIDVVDVTFNVNSKQYGCGVVIPVEGVSFRYFDCVELPK